MTVICQCVPKWSPVKSGKVLLEACICSAGSLVNTMDKKEHEFNNLHMQLWEIKFMVSITALRHGLEKYFLLQNKPSSKTIKRNVFFCIYPHRTINDVCFW